MILLIFSIGYWRRFLNYHSTSVFGNSHELIFRQIHQVFWRTSLFLHIIICSFSTFFLPSQKKMIMNLTNPKVKKIKHLWKWQFFQFMITIDMIIFQQNIQNYSLEKNLSQYQELFWHRYNIDFKRPSIHFDFFSIFYIEKIRNIQSWVNSIDRWYPRYLFRFINFKIVGTSGI